MNLRKKLIKDHKRMNTKTKELTEQRKFDRSPMSWIQLRELKKQKLATKDKINEAN
jgi:uncharacterized protein YdcH (DUF465 family)|tara:strand:- start:967 stop:1134 length:168 start_codon:yes stop_codon:yes gene_type:complete